jgi:hypothetical protein
VVGPGALKAAVEGAAWINHESATYGLSSEEHSESHYVSLRQGDFNRPDLAAEFDHSLNDGSLFNVSARIAHAAVSNQWKLDRHCGFRLPLFRVDLETDDMLPFALDNLQPEGVEGGRARSGIHLRFYSRDPELGEGDPFPPTDQGLRLGRCDQAPPGRLLKNPGGSRP